MGEAADFFESAKPGMVESDINKAAQALRIAIGWNAMPVSDDTGNISAIAIKLQMANDTTETFIIERFPALVLKKLIDRLEKAEWNEKKVLPDRVWPGQPGTWNPLNKP
jgi:hypothetical protein